MLKTGAVALAAAAAMAAATPSQAASFLSATTSSACGNDGCFSDTTRTFTQAFSAQGFQGTVDVGTLHLDRAILGGMQDQSFKVSFHLADGTALGTWGSYMIAVLGGQIVTLSGDAIQWDTSRGDLVLQLDLILPDKGGVGGGGMFGGGGGGGGGGSGLGLAAFAGGDDVQPANHFDNPNFAPAVLHPAVAVVEPEAWSLMILGFGAAGALLRRRRFALV